MRSVIYRPQIAQALLHGTAEYTHCSLIDCRSPAPLLPSALISLEVGRCGDHSVVCRAQRKPEHSCFQGSSGSRTYEAPGGSLQSRKHGHEERVALVSEHHAGQVFDLAQDTLDTLQGEASVQNLSSATAASSALHVRQDSEKGSRLAQAGMLRLCGLIRNGCTGGRSLSHRQMQPMQTPSLSEAPSHHKSGVLSCLPGPASASAAQTLDRQQQ